MTGPKQIGPPLLPTVTEWDPPDVSGVDQSPARPDNSFNDDRVGAHLKHVESAKARQAVDRVILEGPRQVHEAVKRVVEAGAFRPAMDDDQARQAARQSAPWSRRRNKRVPRRDPRTIARNGDLDVQHVEAKIEALWGDLVATEDALAVAWEQGEGERGEGKQREEKPGEGERSQQTQDGDLDQVAGQAERLRLQGRQQRLETLAKQHLQLLLAGGIGLSLLGDPRLTFKRLFDRIHKWPRQVVPGRRPETPDEFDAFLAYIFKPPPTEHDIESW